MVTFIRGVIQKIAFGRKAFKGQAPARHFGCFDPVVDIDGFITIYLKSINQFVSKMPFSPNAPNLSGVDSASQRALFFSGSPPHRFSSFFESINVDARFRSSG
jgi:hypothetical protein